nr:T-cell receptor delta chain VDJ junction region [mice, liver, gamma delta T cells, 96BLT-8, Peptide Partial, 20 aa] [Mus sp.]
YLCAMPEYRRDTSVPPTDKL